MRAGWSKGGKGKDGKELRECVSLVRLSMKKREREGDDCGWMRRRGGASGNGVEEGEGGRGGREVDRSIVYHSALPPSCTPLSRRYTSPPLAFRSLSPPLCYALVAILPGFHATNALPPPSQPLITASPPPLSLRFSTPALPFTPPPTAPIPPSSTPVDRIRRHNSLEF